MKGVFTMKKILSLVLCIVLCMGMMAACGSSQGNKVASKDETVKIGVLVADATTPESLAFRAYYENYIAKNYNVEFMYSTEVADAAAEKSAIDNFITNNCKAVISFASADRPAQLQQCSKAKVYYAVATGVLTAEQYEEAKENPYYIGAIGPSNDVEFQAGYQMAKYFLDKGMKKFAMFGGTVAYYQEMHIYRAAGMIQAMIDAQGGDANYLGATTKEAVVGKIYESADVKLTKIGDVEIVGYLGGYTMDDAWWASAGQMCATPGLEAVLSVGNGSDFFGAMIDKDKVAIGSVDAYAEAYGEAMKTGTLDYLAGKFSASIGPIFIATYSACLGTPIRDNGNALALEQGYWVATSHDQFTEYYAIDSSVEAPAYTKTMLDTILETDFKKFSDFVGKYTFDEISAMK